MFLKGNQSTPATSNLLYDKDSSKQIHSNKYSLKYDACNLYSTEHGFRNYPRRRYFTEKNSWASIFAQSTKKSSTLGPSILKSNSKPDENVDKLDNYCHEKFYQNKKLKSTKNGLINKKVQTTLRESHAQTRPWEPTPVITNTDAEIFKIDFLEWGKNLPPGVEAVNLIKHARIKKNILSESKNQEDVSKIIEDSANFEWIQREKYMDDLNKLRMKLWEEMLNKYHKKSYCRAEHKIDTLINKKLIENELELFKIKCKYQRDLRKLEWKYKDKTKRNKLSVFTEYSDCKSELYLPLIRHGSNPKYWHEKIRRSNYKVQFYNVQNYNTFPVRSLKKPRFELKTSNQRTLCIRETKWTESALKDLHSELKNVRIKETQQLNLRTLKTKKLLGNETISNRIINENEKKDQGCLYIQKVLRGRARQLSIFEGLFKCRELINELQDTVDILDNKAYYKKMVETKTEQVKEIGRINDYNRIGETLKSLGFEIVGSLFGLLSMELERLVEERKIHALVMIHEREKIKREAAESGRRQLEIMRRKEHDEMFKQVLKIKQETVDLYLQDIITEGVEFASKNQAKLFVKKLSRELKSTSNQTYLPDEYVADVYHNFLLPNVNKTIIREKEKIKQSKYLQNAHNEIFGLTEVLPAAKINTGIFKVSDKVITVESNKSNKNTPTEDLMKYIRNLLDELTDASSKEHVFKSSLGVL